MTVSLFASAPGHMCFAPMASMKPAVQPLSRPAPEPPSMPFLAPETPLYYGLELEAKARLAIVNAFVNSPVELTSVFLVRSCLGFGSNGCVLSARNIGLEGAPKAVAIKVIYKSKVSKNEPAPAEIDAARALHGLPLLTAYVADWQDSHHHYLVTEIFGSNWEAAAPLPIGGGPLKPLVFKLTHEGEVKKLNLPFSAGSSDLWAFSQAHRAHMFKTQRHSYLPIEPVKHILREMATALSQIHDKGYYHGDIKIENCLVRSNPSNPDAPSIRLTDLGHCKPASAPISSYGTQDVSPPEFLFDSPLAREQVDGRAADVFALGMCLYLLLNADGELPRAVDAIRARMVGYQDLLARDEGRYPLDEIADLEESAWDLLHGMCRVNPADRLTIEQVLEHKWFC